MVVSGNRGTPSHHPNFSGIFHEIFTIQLLGTPMAMETNHMISICFMDETWMTYIRFYGEQMGFICSSTSKIYGLKDGETN